MLTRIMKPRDEREAGFTLIELLVVVVIIGILAAIAIPVFLSQRNAARTASVESDLRNIGTVMETAYTQDDAYPLNTAELTVDYDAAPSSVGNYVEVLLDGTSYYAQGCNWEAGDDSVRYYAPQGGGVVDAPPLLSDGVTTATAFTCPTTAPGDQLIPVN